MGLNINSVDSFKKYTTNDAAKSMQNPVPAVQNTQTKEQPVVTTAVQDTFSSTIKTADKKEGALDKFAKYSGLVALGALPVVAVVTNKMTLKSITKNQDNLVKTIEDKIGTTVNKTIEEAIEQSPELRKLKAKEKSLWATLATALGVLNVTDLAKDYIAKDDKDSDAKDIDTVNKVGEKLKEIGDKANSAIDRANSAFATHTKGALHSKYLDEVHGFMLLKGVDKKAGFNQVKYDNAIEEIKNSASLYMNGEAQAGKTPLKKGDSVWSITSEFAPIKEGGLGAVPVDIQNNFEKIGINTPTFIPMYQKNGFATLKNHNGDYTYNYNGTEFKLDKAATFRVHSYKRNDSKDTPVEVFVSTEKIVKGKSVKTAPLVFIKNDEYFNGSIYSRGAKSEEPEKFAFFSKAVYEFAKAKLDPNSVKGLKVDNQEAYSSIQAPDGLILNDWQASPMAAMSRYKAPIENAYGGLSDEASKQLKEMKIVTIGHNAQYQGSTQLDNDYNQKVEVSENILNTLFDNFASEIVQNANTGSEYENLSNSVVLNPTNGERHVNMLNMGITLSDYFAPVSENYAQELVNENSKSGALQWALTQRNNSETLKGVINGNDFKNLEISAKAGFIGGLNPDNKIDVKTYTHGSSKKEVQDARAHNKIEFYRKYMIPVTTGELRPKNMENIGTTNLPNLSDEEIINTPIISYSHRLVGQKGVDILVDSIKNIYANWEKDFPNQPKPIFYLGGEDGEGGQYKAMLTELKEKLGEDSNRVIFNHGFNPNPALMACSDFFLMPSKFEPCGLTQSEAFALATPVIATATGGIVDTVEDNKTGILSAEISADGFTNALKEGIDIYFNDKAKYEEMTMDSLAQDFSWIKDGSQGPAFDYLNLLGFQG